MLLKRNFLPLFIVQFLGATNDNILKNAILVMVTFGIIRSEVPGVLINLAAGLFILPFLIFGAWAGIIAEKHDKAILSRRLKILELVIAIIACIGLFTHSASVLLVALFGLGVQATFFGPVKYALIPQYLLPKYLMRGNAYIEGGTFIAILLGTILGASTITGEHGSAIVSTLLVGVATIGYIASRYMPPAPASNPHLAFEPNIIRATSEVIKEVMNRHILVFSVLAISWFWFLGAIILTQLPLFVKEYLHEGETAITVFLAIFSVGIGIGSVACERISHGDIKLKFVLVGAVGIALFLGDLAFFANGVARSAVDFFAISFFSGFFTVPLYSLLQKASDVERRSRAIAANNILNALFMVVASLFGMLIFSLGYSLKELFAVLLLLHIAATIYGYKSARKLQH
ncbi:MAG: MFS transporter [Campylobacterales bacterium]|nr:MFS transporter [Campylobacterales bacterium]